MAKKPTVNLKKEAGRALKADNEAKKQAQQDRQREAAEAKEWQQGANARKASKDEVAASKADEAARKRQEKAALLAAEEEAIRSGASAKKAGAGGAAQRKKGPKSDLAMLEESLQREADKKVKMKRQDLLKKKEQEQQKVVKEEEPVDPLLANTDRMIGLLDEDIVGRQANKAKMMEEGASGIDAALGALNVTGGGGGGGGIVKSAKALYNEFEARMMPVVKEEFPGLRLSQYKEKIWQQWRKSPDNPANQVPTSSAPPS